MPLTTIIAGILTTAGTPQAFTHGLGTTPDIIIPIVDTNPAVITTYTQLAITTYNTQTFTLDGPISGMTFRALVIRLHSIIR